MMVTLDAYAVRSCPLKTFYRFQPGLVKPEAAAQKVPVLEAGKLFDDRILARLVDAAPAVFDGRTITDLSSEEQRAATLAALESGTPLLIRPLLPDDRARHRSGRPDVLVRVTAAGEAPGYCPVEIKFHHLYARGMAQGQKYRYSTLAEPERIIVADGKRLKWNIRVKDLMHLAHDWRMLQDCGFAAPGLPRAAIIATDEVVAGNEVLSWVRLDGPLLMSNTLLHVGHSFALPARGGASVPPVVPDIGVELDDFDETVDFTDASDRIPEPEASADRELANETALVLEPAEPIEPTAEVPGGGVEPEPVQGPQITVLDRYDAEFGFRIGLAENAAGTIAGDPPPLLPIIHDECGYCPWLPRCRSFLADDDVSVSIMKAPLAPHEVVALRSLGIVTIPELASRDVEQLLVDYLPLVEPGAVAETRIRTVHRRATMIRSGVELLRINHDRIDVPQAPVEIDFDIETAESGRVYLWGFRLLEPGEAPRYVHFSSFDDMDDAAEAALATAAMSWLRAQVADREALVYHYSDYERVRIRQLHRRAKSAELAWVTQWGPHNFVDLFTVIKKHFFGLNGLGLKVIATTQTDFRWRDEDPGGLNSMRWYEEAIHAPTPAERDAARIRLLQYNEDDTKATWHVRQWLRQLDVLHVTDH